MSDNLRIWDAVPGCPDYGYDLDWNVYRVTPALGTFSGRKCKSYTTKEGRIAWNLRGPDGRPKTVFRSAIVCTHFHGPRPNGMFALHGNGDPTDDSKDNLRWGTQKENMADRKSHGREPRLIGERHGMAKLTAKQVAYVRASKARHVDLAKELNVSASLIHHIRIGLIWKEAA